jgi:peroxiredoxin/uncharacterized membrane protein YphA (DoxX/SURF4 family)
MATAVLGLRLVLAAVFLLAGVAKLLDLKGSRRAVRDFGVPARAAGIVGTALPLLELAAAVALVFRPSARWGAAAALVLLLAFVGGIARALARGEQPDCHCFGQVHSAPASGMTLARNVALGAFAAVVVAYGSGPAVDTWISAHSAAVLAAILLGVCAAAAAGYALSLRATVGRLKDDLTIARHKAARAQGVAIGFSAPDFTAPDVLGERVGLSDLLERDKPVLLMFMSPWCGPCANMMPRVRQWQQSLSDRLTLALISSGTQEQNQVFVENGIEDVLVQESFEVSELFGVKATPSAVFITREGKIASTVAESEFGIEPLVRLAIRGGISPAMQEPAA